MPALSDVQWTNIGSLKHMRRLTDMLQEAIEQDESVRDKWLEQRKDAIELLGIKPRKSWRQWFSWLLRRS